MDKNGSWKVKKLNGRGLMESLEDKEYVGGENKIAAMDLERR